MTKEIRMTNDERSHKSEYNMKSLISLFAALMFAAIAHGAEPVTAAKALPAVTLEGFKLIGDLSDECAEFTLTATAQVENSKGASLELLSGPVALTEIG